MEVFAIDPMLCAMARLIGNEDTVTTGVASALPMLAVALARATHAPGATYLNCVGAVNPVWEGGPLPPSSVDAGLLPGDAFIRLEEIWEMANRGRIDLMFFGAFQIDARGRTNLHRLRSGRKLPGIAGASTMRRKVGRAVVFSTRHDGRTFVPQVDAVTTSPRPGEPSLVVTPLALLTLGAGTPCIDALLPGHRANTVQSRTGFELTWTEPPRSIEPPRDEELAALHRLDPKGARRRFL